MANTITPTPHQLSLPLPLYTAEKIATFTDSRGESFDIMLGADESIVQQLRKKSLDTTDTDLQDNTSDFKRFGGGSYEEWYSKGRTPFALVHQASVALAAFAWFGPKPLGRKSLKYLSEAELKEELNQKEKTWHTLVYRSYLPYRGKGLMGDFIRFAIAEYRKHYPEAKLWVGGNADNAASMGLAERLGFKRRDDLFDAEKNWMAMVQE
ncbi:MAG: hypothetical protein A2854_03950 [Parcubacteria group bacterium RIFCSPHIGHO2_01_FULL_56_18]|nr:MAG: hypothetical protein A2854_03950 [Parcubacteria group bacterium RIFCSPHIGHO2_01_FULL_56_18]